MTDSEAESDAELLDRAASRDAAALRILLKRFGPEVREAMRGKIDARWRSVLEEDDLMQVTYLEAFLHIDQLSARDTTSFVGWLIRIAQNTLRDAVRALERQKRPHPARRVHEPENHESSCVALLELLGVTTTTPSRDAAEKEASRSIEAALKTLPPDYSAVVRLTDLEGKSAAEVAAEMGRSVGAIHMLRARAHARLQVCLGTASRFFSDSP